MGLCVAVVDAMACGLFLLLPLDFTLCGFRRVYLPLYLGSAMEEAGHQFPKIETANVLALFS